MKMENRDDFEKKIKKFQFLPSKHPLKLAISGEVKILMKFFKIIPFRRTLISE